MRKRSARITLAAMPRLSTEAVTYARARARAPQLRQILPLLSLSTKLVCVPIKCVCVRIRRCGHGNII